MSDHTNDINSSLAATALGATMIEKHFKISNRIKSPDSKFSILPSQLKMLKNMSVKIHETIGNNKPKKKVSGKALFFRRSIFTKRDLKKGTIINENNISVLRPKIGIGAEEFFNVIGKKLNKNIKKNSPVFFTDLK